MIIRNFFAAVLTLMILAQARAAEKFTRPAMMEAMARNCIVSGLNEMAAASEQLFKAADQLRKEPSTNSVTRTQQAWVDLRLAFKRNQMLCRGPVKDDAFWTMLFFPQALPAAVENVIRSTRAINPDFIELLGSSAKGFYALEYLLFDAPHGGAALIGSTNGTVRSSLKQLLESPTAERRRLYVAEMARALDSKMRDAATEAKAADFIPKFGAGGQDSVNLLVNQVLDGIETGVLQSLHNYTNQMQIGSLRYDMIEGAASGTSFIGFSAALDGVRRFYLGGKGSGIDDYVRHVNPELADRLETQFKTTGAALAAVNAPIEEAILKNPDAIHRAIGELRILEQLCKVDVVAALGVTVLFSTNDGD